MCMCVVVCAVKLDMKKKRFLVVSLNVGKHLLLLLFCMNMPHQDHRLLPVLLSYVCVHTDRCCRTTQQTPPLISLL